MASNEYRKKSLIPQDFEPTGYGRSDENSISNALVDVWGMIMSKFSKLDIFFKKLILKNFKFISYINLNSGFYHYH